MHCKRLFAAVFAGSVALFAAHAVCAQTAATRTASPTAESVPPQIDAVFAAWDSDKNGSLSRQEFKNGWLALRQMAEMQTRLHTQFNLVDSDKSGAIDAKEYANLELVKKAGPSAPPLSTFDANKNQRLEFAEYLNFVRQMTAPKPATPAAKSP
jgi:Ca2+-binding EF-hand superfamily protein